jgi:hypothetical protein
MTCIYKRTLIRQSATEDPTELWRESPVFSFSPPFEANFPPRCYEKWQKERLLSGKSRIYA